MDTAAYINELSSNGRFSFSLIEAITTTGKSKAAVTGALYRQIKHNRLAHPVRGFYVIIPPPYQRYRCAPAEYWIDDLMVYRNQKYYVGLLSAAKYYAAAHQKPQIFQVITDKTTRPIECGNVAIQFIKSDGVESVPVRKFNTPTGYISVESPEALLIDLIRHPVKSGGINNVATVLTELEESIDPNKMVAAFSTMQFEQVLMQRLGYMLELIGADTLASKIEKILQTKTLRIRPLVNGVSTRGCIRNKRWQLYINYEVEPDL